MSLTEARVREVLSQVADPALDHDIVAWRIFRACEIRGDDVLVHVDIPTHAYPQADRRRCSSPPGRARSRSSPRS
jgi:hypothetical protein